ncbi:MAG: hypothetical protein HY537_00465 [Deltaproteobacteria bacterium]|nr:hypothetical protein [Deltaproteobacteria bacterium]
MGFRKCPRCGWNCLEKLKTHSHCVNCFYFPDEERQINREVNEINYRRAKRKWDRPMLVLKKTTVKDAA